MPLYVGLMGHLDSSDGCIRANIGMVDAEGKANLLDKLVKFVQQDEAWFAGSNVDCARPVTIMACVKRRPHRRSVIPAFLFDLPGSALDIFNLSQRVDVELRKIARPGKALPFHRPRGSRPAHPTGPGQL